MKTIAKSLPDLGRIFQKMKLQDRLDAVDPEKTILGLSIGISRRDKTPLETIANNVFGAYQDNPGGVTDIVGEETIQLIKQIYKK